MARFAVVELPSHPNPSTPDPVGSPAGAVPGHADDSVSVPQVGLCRLTIVELGIRFFWRKPVEHQVDHSQLDECLR